MLSGRMRGVRAYAAPTARRLTEASTRMARRPPAEVVEAHPANPPEH